MTIEELEAVWSSLLPPSAADGTTGKRAAGLPPDRPAYLAVDGRGRRHLLIQIPSDTATISERETRSLEISTTRFQVGPNAEALYVDLACTDSSQYPTFNAVVQDMIRSLRVTSGPPRDSILNAIARWRAFWNALNEGLSREDALGLFGELWFLWRWLGPPNRRVLERWQVTETPRHDFQWEAASVEVKTTAVHNSGDPIHRIASLDQLADPVQGNLYLFSLQVADDALATNTLHRLVENLTDQLRDDFAGLNILSEKLAARGYSPVDKKYASRTLRVMNENLYRIGNGFPRLLKSTFEPAGMPVGVAEVSYAIDLAACRKWLVASSPGQIDLR